MKKNLRSCMEQAPRCPYATEECSQEDIPYVEINGVKVKCRNIEEVPVWT